MAVPGTPSILRRVIYTVPSGGDAFGDEHERRGRMVMGEALARLLDGRFGGELEPSSPRDGAYFLPSDTLRLEEAARLGVGSQDDLFGGVVPHPFVGTKAISHGLVAPDAQAPEGWRPELAGELGEAVLKGFTAFCRADAERAGRELLKSGAVRLKQVTAVAGWGQSVAADAEQLRDQLDGLDWAAIARTGLALEEDLKRPTTYSVGQVRVGGRTASYYGLQKAAVNRRGRVAYAGTVLLVARGGFDELLGLELLGSVRLAVRQARAFDAAVERAWPDFFASRRNYDVLQGFDSAGRLRSGVLEQSWRVGGASGAELAALLAFDQSRERQVVKARTVEEFSQDAEVPAGALVLFQGLDPRVGPLTKYAVAEPV